MQPPHKLQPALFFHRSVNPILAKGVMARVTESDSGVARQAMRGPQRWSRGTWPGLGVVSETCVESSFARLLTVLVTGKILL